MSANNGDRSRHNRMRKAKERRRVISRATRAEQAVAVVAVPAVAAVAAAKK
jgi:hypothetical protein